MTASNWQVRRATLDDLVVLRRLWQQERWSVADLEKRFREFQVVETATGELHGALGLEVAAPHGKIHSEAFQRSQLADELRPRLWERVQSVARNHGLTRLWIADPASVFWLEAGFEMAGTELVRNLPASWHQSEGQRWLMLKLREETTAALSVEQELALFRQSQQEQSQRVTQQARLLRTLACVVVGAVLVLMGWAAWTILTRLNRPARR